MNPMFKRRFFKNTIDTSSIEFISRDNVVAYVSFRRNRAKSFIHTACGGYNETTPLKIFSSADATSPFKHTRINTQSGKFLIFGKHIPKAAL